MWLFPVFLVLLLAVRGLVALFKSLHGVPRSNRDWIFY